MYSISKRMHQGGKEKKVESRFTNIEEQTPSCTLRTSKRIKVIADNVGRIDYPNGMALFIDYDARKGRDNYILFTSKGEQALFVSAPKLYLTRSPISATL